ncbi:MAG: tyrosine-type recombinase/integrase [Deltaproteobacteria bacterium]|nr:tyrosine-type recombinase/integrase [Deltaproteobacteria bacterium]
MTDLAPHLTAFLQEHLPNERRLSRHTVQGYTDCFRLLVLYVAEQTGIRPCALKIEHFTVALLLSFLEFLENSRNNSVGTRNIRLAAIKSFFRYVEYRVPGCLDLALRVRAIPHKRADKPLVDWLDRVEMQAILDAPDTATVAGLRDRAMLHLCYAAGLRVSELIGLTLDSLSGPQLETIHILGKGRRDRELPLWKETKSVLNEWLDVRPPVKNRYLFLNARGRAMSSDGFAYILKQHVTTAARKAPSIGSKRVTPHVLRHSTAMTILHATGDIRKVSLWLGHADIKSTEAYLRASPAEKLGILDATTPPSIQPGTFHGAKDSLMRVLGGR